MSDKCEQIRRIVEPRRQEMIDDLARHVAIPTGKNFAVGLDEYRSLVVERLEAIGARTETVAGIGGPSWIGSGEQEDLPPPVTVVCKRDVPAEPRILIAGHLDTVFDPDGSFQRMEIASDEQRAVGPGVVDMKGGVLIGLVALEALAETGQDIAWTFLLNSDEETGSYASDHVLRQQAGKHHWGLALEPALPDGSLAIERKGSGQFHIEVYGRAAHAGREFEKGVSAVYKLARVLQEIEGLSDLKRGVTINVGPVTGGTATNVVPDHAAAWANARFTTKADGDELIRKIESLATGDGAMPRVVVHHSFNRPAKPLTPQTQQLAEVARSVAEELGQTLPFASTGGVCDGNILQDAGLATIDTLGARGGGLHTHDEWIELDSLVERATLLACLIGRLSELEPSAHTHQ